MKVVVEAYNKENELLESEIELQEKYQAEIFEKIGLSSEDIVFLCSGTGGFDLTETQIRVIEAIIGESIYSMDYDFQLGTS